MTVLRRDFVRFVIVGSFGFLVDLGVLTALMHGAAWGPFTARIMAMAIAIMCTWWLHRHWTFRMGRIRSPIPQSLVYGTVQVIGLSLNYAVFLLLVLSGGPWRTYPALAAGLGSISAMVISYVLSKNFVFAKASRTVGWMRETPRP